MVENENKKDNFPDFGYRIILLVISLPAGMIVGRWLPQMILPFGENGFDIHVIVAIISASLVLQLLLFPFRKLLSAAGTLGMLILVVMLYNGQITKADLLDSYWRGVSEITNHDYGGKSMDQQIGIQAAIADDNGIVQFVNQSIKI
jgi:branched-subunit amino acid transport protein AzlD